MLELSAQAELGNSYSSVLEQRFPTRFAVAQCNLPPFLLRDVAGECEVVLFALEGRIVGDDFYGVTFAGFRPVDGLEAKLPRTAKFLPVLRPRFRLVIWVHVCDRHR